MVKLQAFDSNYFQSKSQFEDDGTQNYLVFQQVSRYFRAVPHTSKVTTWKSEGFPNETINLQSTCDNDPGISYFDNARKKSTMSWKLFKARKSYIYT